MSDYSDTSQFYQLLKDPVNVKVLDFMIRRPEQHHGARDVASVVGESFYDVQDSFELFEEMGMVSKDVEKAVPVFQTVKGHEVVQAFVEAHIELVVYADELTD